MSLWTGTRASSQNTLVPPYGTNPEFQRAYIAAVTASIQDPRNLNATIKAFRKADSIAGGHCVECYVGMFRAASTNADHKKAIQIAKELEAVAITPADRSTAQFLQGRGLLQQAGTDRPKPALLEAAHAAITKGIQTDPDNLGCYYLDGLALAMLDRDAEARADFVFYFNHAPKGDALLTRVKHFAENPDLARHKMAPPVVVTTAEGKRLDLDNLGNMTWHQYRDTTGAIGAAFNVRAIPHYFTIDSDGVLTAENIGGGSDIDGRLKKLVQRARESAHPERQQPVLTPDKLATPGE